MSKKSIKLITYDWEKFSDDVYTMPTSSKKQINFKAGGQDFFRPVLGGHVMAPNTGKYYWEYKVNGDNMKVGVATPDANLAKEAGTDADSWVVFLQTGACENNGVEQKKVWRLIVPVSGGHFGFMLDTDRGTLQLYFNDDYHGMIFNEDSGLKGKTLVPCVAIAGIEDNNRDIGFGQKKATVMEAPVLPRTLVL
eukprot:PhM_4_TR11162/c0_g1_i1/m.3023